MEKSFKGTSGEWKIVTNTTSSHNPPLSIRSEDFDNSDMMADYQGRIVCSFEDAHGNRPHAYAEAKANAHLIAASKDLLEACIADVRNMYDGEEHVGYQVGGMNGRVLCTFELTEFDRACQYVENLRKAAISKALNTTSNE